MVKLGESWFGFEDALAIKSDQKQTFEKFQLQCPVFMLVGG